MRRMVREAIVMGLIWKGRLDAAELLLPELARASAGARAAGGVRWSWLWPAATSRQPHARCPERGGRREPPAIPDAEDVLQGFRLADARDDGPRCLRWRTPS